MKLSITVIKPDYAEAYISYVNSKSFSYSVIVDGQPSKLIDNTLIVENISINLDEFSSFELLLHDIRDNDKPALECKGEFKTFTEFLKVLDNETGLWL